MHILHILHKFLLQPELRKAELFLLRLLLAYLGIKSLAEWQLPAE